MFFIIAHDLRSPFNNILGFSELLVEEIARYDIPEFKKKLNYIRSSAKSTLVLLDNLLNWSKTQTGEFGVNLQTIKLTSVVKEVFEFSKSGADKKNISLNFPESEEIEFYADQNMVKTILRNLISNAIKFTNTHGEINIFAFKNEKFVEITVSDNGIGMSDKVKSEIFKLETNSSTNGTEDERGSGLGLVLCKELVKKHGGEIWVESVLGKGSAFKFTLPLSNSK